MIIENPFFDYFKAFNIIGGKQKYTKFYPKNWKYKKMDKYNLQAQLFLIRDLSAIKKITELTSLKTRDYEFEWKLENMESYNDVYKIEIESKSNFETRFQKDFFYLIFSQKYNFILILGYFKSQFLKKRINAFLKEYYPKISITFLSQNEIKSLLKYIMSRNQRQYQVELEMLVYRKVTSKTKPRKKSFEKAIDYIGADLMSKISELEEDKKYIDTIGLNVKHREKKRNFKFSFNRYNRILWSSGSLSNLIEILGKIYELSKEKFDLLDNRERKYTKNHQSKPIILKLNSSIFSSIRGIKKFQEVINKFPFCNHAVIHAGNPMLHLILRDQKDNSIFSIKNLNNKDLMVCPQIIGSNSSLVRILDLISERISEFEVIDYQKYKEEFHKNLKNFN